MSTNTKAISDEIRQAAYDCARGIYLNVDDGGTPYMTDDDILEVAKAIHDAVMAERERFSRATPEMIAAAWATWKPRNPKSLGPGPGFVEAINAALAAAPKAEG